MAGIELCKFTHGLGLYILRFYPSLSLGVKFEFKGPAHVRNNWLTSTCTSKLIDEPSEHVVCKFKWQNRNKFFLNKQD